MSANRTVDLDGLGIPREATADGAGILPGMLLELNVTAGGVVTVDIYGGTSGALVVPNFAVENSALGGDILGLGDGAYASGGRVQYRSFSNGALVNAIAGDMVTAGDFLMAETATGHLVAATAGTHVIAQALEGASDTELMTVQIMTGYLSV